MQEEEIDDVEYFKARLSECNQCLRDLGKEDDLRSILLVHLNYLIKLEMALIDEEAYEVLLDEVDRAIKLSKQWLLSIGSKESLMQEIGKSIDKVNWAIIEYNYDILYKRSTWLRQELAEYFYHPRRIEKWLRSGRKLEEYMV